ncbi:hypothetical protein BHE74_00006537 [Ensete ventricosum]|nr:hypothetical protein BHE74_00006537 [Ensete ventricosum]
MQQCAKQGRRRYLESYSRGYECCSLKELEGRLFRKLLARVVAGIAWPSDGTSRSGLSSGNEDTQMRRGWRVVVVLAEPRATEWMDVLHKKETGGSNDWFVVVAGKWIKSGDSLYLTTSRESLLVVQEAVFDEVMLSKQRSLDVMAEACPLHS